MTKNKGNRKDPAYIREQGKRAAEKKKDRTITFSFSRHIKGNGETYEEWSTLGLLGPLCRRMQMLGQHSVFVVKQKQWIKDYNSFPPHSEFDEPTHISNVTWSVMHITDTSKEVVVGFIEDDVFYIVFLDKDHKFWPTTKKRT